MAPRSRRMSGNALAHSLKYNLDRQRCYCFPVTADGSKQNFTRTDEAVASQPIDECGRPNRVIGFKRRIKTP